MQTLLFVMVLIVVAVICGMVVWAVSLINDIIAALEELDDWWEE